MKSRLLIAFGAAQVFSISGTRLSTIAIPWLVLTTTGSPVLTGLVALAEMLPYVLAKALSGPLIDRLGPRPIAIACDTASIFAVSTVPLLHLSGMLSVELLIPIVVVMGVLRGPSDAAKHAMVPDIATLAGVPLERVTGIAGVVERLASTVGAAAAGALIAVIGPSEALVVNAATFLFAALTVAVAIPSVRRPEAAPERPVTSYGRDLREGWDFLRRDTLLVSVVVMLTVLNLFDQAFGVVLLPVWTREAGHDAAMLGLMFAIFSGASVGGAAIAAATGERLPRLGVYVVAYVLTGIPRFAVYALDAPLAIILATLAISGFASGFLNPILSAVIFERIPRPLVGRVSALITALCWALIPFGGVFGGMLIAGIGLDTALLATGIAYLVATLLPMTLKEFRDFGRRPPLPQS